MTADNLIDNSPITGFHKKLLVQSAGGPFLDGWLLSIIGIALVGMTPDLGLSVVPGPQIDGHRGQCDHQEQDDHERQQTGQRSNHRTLLHVIVYSMFSGRSQHQA